MHTLLIITAAMRRDDRIPGLWVRTGDVIHQSSWQTREDAFAAVPSVLEAFPLEENDSRRYCRVIRVYDEAVGENGVATAVLESLVHARRTATISTPLTEIVGGNQ